jgi:hypothetical protein
MHEVCLQNKKNEVQMLTNTKQCHEIKLQQLNCGPPSQQETRNSSLHLSDVPTVAVPIKDTKEKPQIIFLTIYFIY